MAVTLVQGNPVRTTSWSGSSTGNLAYASPVTSGNLLACSVSGTDAQSISSVADNVNAGNWSAPAGAARSGNGSNVAIFYKVPTGAGTPTVTVTLSASSSYQVTIYECSGASQLSLDQTNNNTATGGGVSNPGNLNTTLANSIIIAATENLGSDSTAGTSYTFLDSVNGSFFAGAQYRIVSSTSNYSTAFGTDTGNNWTAVAANFGESAAVSVSSPLLNTLQFIPFSPGGIVWTLMNRLPNPAPPLASFNPNPSSYVNKFPGQRPGSLIWMLMYGISQKIPLLSPSTTITFRKTLSTIGTGIGKRQTHNTN